MSRECVTFAVLIGLQLVSSIFDLKSYRIPNMIVYPGMLAGLALSWHGWADFGAKLAFILVFDIIAVLFPMGGAGDIKLIMMTACFLGPMPAVYAALIAALALLAIVFIRSPARLWLFIMTHRVPPDGKKYAFAPFILAGTLITGGYLCING